MATGAASIVLAAQARRAYVDNLVKGLPALFATIDDAARTLLTKVAEPPVVLQRREAVEALNQKGRAWTAATEKGLHDAASSNGVRAEPPRSGHGSSSGGLDFTLVEDSTIEGEIVSSRLALAIMDRASWEFSDLRSRMATIEGSDELAAHDVLRPHVLARTVTTAWHAAGFSNDNWRVLQPLIHDEFGHLAEEAYHEVNRLLVERGVLAEIDLRPFIRRSRGGAVPPPSSRSGLGGGDSVQGTGFHAERTSTFAPTGAARDAVSQETRMQTRTGSIGRGATQAEAVLGRLNRLIWRQIPDFAATTVEHPQGSQALAAAIGQAQQGIAQRLAAPQEAGHEHALPISTPAMLEELHQRKIALKQAAATPVERATIEVVALLFQSLLTEERLPATVRVWFARLQMPVLRVAVGEPDFFATVDHPARRLIDRMGACVMGFDASLNPVGAQLELEIKRIVQVVEAYPDTGRRVFQTVLNEFEEFLENFFRNENEASRKGISLAQQVEQRETLAIQYTIELRKMLSEMPVQDGIREFLFHVWADVLAVAAVKEGLQSDATRALKKVAADLIWSASAKVTREDRAAVIRQLPQLLKALRDGMQSVGMSAQKQDEHVQRLNDSLAAAFTAKVATISSERMAELQARLETLEELLPDADDVEIDESMVLDLSGHESSELEIVGEGGSMPTAEMMAWARELQVGTWYMLDYRNRNEPVQLAWRGMRHQLALFVTQQGRGVLFQQNRLASFLQAGLLVPAQDETLTVKATRSAMAKIDADPRRLEN
ncbi:DUF1631 family protein [Piscinibacter sakaiensis]|uniref:DUF1631 family protein n=1 Tax=Piscinibacter sakaiensis TaxID=1547922 RepID=UPI003AAEE514